MLRLVENPSIGYVLNENEYVMLSVDGMNAMLMKSDGNEVFFLASFNVCGGEPSARYWEEIRSILGVDRIYSWHVDGCYSDDTIEMVVDWLRRDCHYIDDDWTIVLVGDTTSTTPIPERREFFLENYSEEKVYTGMGSYHSSHSETMNVPIKEMKPNQYRIGVELEIEARSRGDKRDINRVRSNWFFQERDGSLSDERGIEIVTIPLLPKDAMSEKTWSPLVEFLKTKAESYNRSNCGLHVHIGREAFGKSEDARQATLGKLLFFYYEFLKPTDWNSKVFGRRSTYSEQAFHCKESEAVKVLGMDLMKSKEIAEKVDKGLKRTANQTRYYDINIQNSATIEFRKGKGSICTERIIAVITYCDLMVKYCRNRDWGGMSDLDFLAYIRKNVSKSSPLFRYLPTAGEEE